MDTRSSVNGDCTHDDECYARDRQRIAEEPSQQRPSHDEQHAGCEGAQVEPQVPGAADVTGQEGVIDGSARRHPQVADEVELQRVEPSLPHHHSNQLPQEADHA